MFRKKSLLKSMIAGLAFSLAFAGAAHAQKKAVATTLPKVNWTLQTTWAQGWLLHDMAEDMARRVDQMSGGNFKIDVLPAGAVVGGLEVLDATHSGVIDAYHSWPGYWMSKHPSAPFFASIPMSLEPLMHVTWFYAYGGKELLQEMYDEIKLSVYAIPGGVTHPELLAHSNKPLNNLNDFKGLKYRTPGWWGEILKGMGVSVTMLPGTELYPALERGILDALEFSSPIVNRQQGFHEVTQYLAGPGMHQPTCFFEFGFNKGKYDALPEHYKEMLQSAAMATTLWSWTQDIVMGIDTFEYWESRGKKFTRVSDEAQREFRKQAWKWIDNDVKAKKNAHYTKTWKSVQVFWTKFLDYEHKMIPVRN
jgi:TRAP-type mannitol/chloroaromatic compound transport system substrate-binding protein